MRAAPGVFVLSLLGCSRGPAPSPFVVDSPEDTRHDSADTDTDTVVITEPEPELTPFGDLPCARNLQCAEAGPFLDGTCCALGDAVELLAEVGGHETVDLVIQDGLALACGGFGGVLIDTSVPETARTGATLSPRCQHSALGPLLPDGSQLAWITHMGDSWLDAPRLWTFRIDRATLEATLVSEQREPDLNFSDLVLHGQHLYVAVRGDGLRIYEVSSTGGPTSVQRLLNSENLFELDVEGDLLYGIDGEDLVVFSLADPTLPREIGRLPTLGGPRDLDVKEGRVAIARGSDGVELIDASDPSAPVSVLSADHGGSAQSVSWGEGFLAVAAWDEFAFLSPTGDLDDMRGKVWLLTYFALF